MARRPSITKTSVVVEMFGMDDFLRQLQRAPAETKKAIKQGNKAIAEEVFVQVKRRSRMVFHASRYQTIMPSMRVVQGTVPNIKVGGAKKATVSRKKRPPAGDLFFGLEFGGGSKPTTQQFPLHRGKKGYVLIPTIVKMHDFIKKEYTDQIERVLKGLTR
jgi:hypothetical protein